MKRMTASTNKRFREIRHRFNKSEDRSDPEILSKKRSVFTQQDFKPSTALYFLFVAKAAPYIIDRYLVPVYAVSFAGLTCLSITILQNVYKTRTMFLVIAVMLSVIVVGEWKNSAWTYLYKPSDKLLEEAKNYKDVDCLYVYNAEWRTQSSFLEVRNYRSVTFVQADHLEDIASYEIADQEKLIVMIIPDKKKNMQKIMEICPQLTKYSEVGRYDSSITYYACSE